jgi:hypothetical protein
VLYLPQQQISVPVDLLNASLFYGETKQLLEFPHINNQYPPFGTKLLLGQW